MSFIWMYIICLTLRLGNTYHEDNHLQHQISIETSQRMNHEHNRKEGFDKFKMKRRETFVVTPAFEMNVLKSSNKNLQPIENTEIQDDGDNVRYKIDGDGYKNDIQDENTISATIKTQDDDYKSIGRYRYNIDGEYAALNSREAMVKVVSKQNALIAKLVSLYQEEINKKEFEKILDSVKQRNYNKCLAALPANDKHSADEKDGES